MMRFIRTLLWLALVATAFEAGLHLVLPHVVGPNLPHQIDHEINRWLMIFVPSALGAGITMLATRKRQPPNSYPGLAIGIVVAGLFALMIIVACMALSAL